jgi:uncharacterized protein YpmB
MFKIVEFLTVIVKCILSSSFLYTLAIKDKSKQIKEAVDKIYGYASDLHHSVDSNHNIKPVFTGDKSDAYMM